MTITSHPVRQSLATGITMLAVIMLLVSGTLSILRGIADLTEDDVILIPNEYSYQLDVTGWGWIHLALGVLLVAVAIGMILTATWARVVTAGLAAVSIIANFASLPYCPWWSVIIIGIDLAVIWAVSSWNPPPSLSMRAAPEPEMAIT
ncbi:DUF7144 family membrane protein [Nocardia alba]|uniref:DUF7144 domain-containing protein n=1 Tax=Nocardia alba TaxID=225051 RepID=A0A4R1FG92_9NOCA|nr:hypothetical protein [Nocardia alba]TCJ93836.1 hypothetical protein DFR71_5694 [Nocardia alba]